jgi:hypothetical protein
MVAQDITFSLADDSLGFSIDADTGVVTTNADFAANYEDAQSQSFTVIATDATGNASAQQLVSVAINNLDEIAPSIDSGDTGTAVDENSGSGQLVYTATATDDADTSNGFSFSLADDSLGFSIDADTGVVTTNADFAADYENAQSQSFTVVATDVAGKASEQVVSVAINNLDEVAPTITSGDSASVLESSGASALVYRALVDDTADISDVVTFSLSTDSDSALSIDALTGEVTLTDVPNVDVQDSYTFTVIADDGVNQSQKSVTLSVVDEDLEAPVFTSSATVAIDENIGENQVIYTAVTDDESLVTYSLSDDVTDLSINSDTGAVTLSTNPDHESQSEYNFTVIATDLTGNSSEQVVSVAINNLDEIAPTITSADSAGSINENTGAGTVIYTATANDSLDISAGVTFSLTGDSDPALSIDPTTGEVILAGDADYEAQPDYTFTVIASDGVNDDVEQSVTLEINNLDEVAPSITSGDTATAVDESSGVDQVVYTATATDTDFNGLVDITFSLADETLGFSIDADTGVVTTNADFAADYEDAQSQSFTVVATDATGNSSGQLVSVAINNLDEVAPSITSGDTAAAIDENTGANQVIYTATADDSADISEGVTFSFAEGNDPALTIDSSTGAVTLTTDPDHEAQNEYSFAVIATDSAGNASEAQPVTLTINDLDDAAPTITSGASAIAIDENTGSGQVIYTATADDSGDDVAQSPITFSLSDSSDTALSIDPSTGAVTLSDDPDHETQNEYSFAVIATDAAGNSSEAQSVTLEINDLDDAAPTITSGATATSIDENSGSDQVVYTATADDSADISDGVSFSLSSDSDTALTIDPSTGVVTLTTDPDHETQAEYNFAVIATDAAGNISEAQSVTFEINNLDDTAPIITSADIAVAIDENSGANTVIYTATADDSHDISAGVTFRLVEDNNSSKFAINKWNGEVTLLTNPDYEETGSLSFTVVASDGVNGDVSKTVTLSINNLDEVAPIITSVSAIAVQEIYVDPDSQSQDLNIFVNEAVYQTIVDDSTDIPTDGSTDITYALTDGSDPAINIDENTGEVTLDTSGLEFSYINQQAYTFGIVATDAANNVSDAHTVILSVEEAIPREASVEVTYSGVDGQPTSNGEIRVSNIKPGSTWEYSTDGGANWESGTYDSDIDTSAIGEGSFTIVGDGEYTVDVRVINAQDVSTALTAPIVVTVDTAPPAPQFVNADSESSVINVVYSESLDATYQPLSTDYSITQQGSELTVSDVQFIDGEDADGNLISNSVLQLTISGDTPFTAGALNFTYAASDNASELVTDLAGNQLDQGFTQMIVSDGYIRDAEVYVDVNGDGIADADELRAEVTSDSYGQIILTDEFLSASENTDENGNPYQVIIKGGVNVDSGAPNEIELTAPAGYSVINPLSTLVQEIASSLEVDVDTQGMTEEEIAAANQAAKDAAKVAAEASLAESLGISLDEGSSLGSYDPQSDDNVANRVVATQIATVLAVASSTESAGAETAALASLADTITEAEGSVTLDSETLGEALEGLIDSDSLETIGTAVNTMEAVKNSQDDADFDLDAAFEEIVQAQAIAIDSVAPKAPVPALATESNSGVSDSDNLTNDTSPEITINLDTTATDGTAVVAGDTVEIFSNDQSETYVLLAEDIENGSFSYNWQGVLTDGVNYISAIAIDRAGNESEYVSTFAFEVDTTELIISSGDTAESIDENSGDNQVIYTATVEGDDLWKFELSGNSDPALTIDSVTGEVTLSTNPNYEIQSQYSFAVTATDNAGNESGVHSVTLDINNLDEIAPTITSADTAVAIDENSGAGQVVYTATANDSLDTSAGVTFSLTGDSDPALSIDSLTGAVTLNADADYETQSQYSFTVIADDAVNEAVEQSVTLDINNLDEGCADHYLGCFKYYIG